MPLLEIIITTMIAPFDLVPPLTTPLPDTMQKQANEAID